MVGEPEATVDRPRRLRARRTRLVAAAALAFVLALVISGIIAARAPSSSRPGGARARHDFRLPDVRDPGATVALSDFRGRPVVVNFWASWCVPCRREMPDLEKVYERVKDRVVFLGVDHEDARADALQFLAETRVRYPIGYDPEGKVARDYGLFGIPTTLFVDAQGRILERHTGALTAESLRRSI